MRQKIEIFDQECMFYEFLMCFNFIVYKIVRNEINTVCEKKFIVLYITQ